MSLSSKHGFFFFFFFFDDDDDDDDDDAFFLRWEKIKGKNGKKKWEEKITNKRGGEKKRGKKE